MGGMFSTRWGGHTRRRMIGQGTPALRARDFAGFVRSPDTRAAELRGTFPVPGRAAGVWTLWAPRMDGVRRLELAAGIGVEAVAFVTLEPVPQPLGGVRWWLRCPGCGHRRAALYLTPATVAPLRPWCRVCLRLVYVSQRCEPAARHEHRMRQLARRLGDPHPDALPDLPSKPHGMHWRTYNRLADTFAAADEARDMLFLGAMHRLLERFPNIGRQGK